MRLLMEAAASAAFGGRRHCDATVKGCDGEGALAVKGRNLLDDGWAMRQY